MSLKKQEPLLQNQQFIFKQQPIEDVNNHKHLGVVMSSNATWYDHILSICQSASKRIGILRGLKHKLSRQALQTIYFSFIRPVFEYADVVWGHSPRHEIYYNLLETLQLEAARIVSGTNRSMSKSKLYQETGWEPLATRRYKHRLILFYKMLNGLAPTHLSGLLPRTRESQYNLRNNDMLNQQFCRTETYRQSLIPCTTRDWNTLPSSLKSATSLKAFKLELDRHFNQAKVPAYFFMGSRYMNIILACLRNGVSQLNGDMHRNHIAEDPSCRCGNQSESVYHYFWECPQYTVDRDALFMAILSLGMPLHIDTILRGCSDMTNAENKTLHTAVCTFIEHSNRFPL